MTGENDYKGPDEFKTSYKADNPELFKQMLFDLGDETKILERGVRVFNYPQDFKEMLKEGLLEPIEGAAGYSIRLSDDVEAVSQDERGNIITDSRNMRALERLYGDGNDNIFYRIVGDKGGTFEEFARMLRSTNGHAAAPSFIAKLLMETFKPQARAASDEYNYLREQLGEEGAKVLYSIARGMAPSGPEMSDTFRTIENINESPQARLLRAANSNNSNKYGIDMETVNRILKCAEESGINLNELAEEFTMDLYFLASHTLDDSILAGAAEQMIKRYGVLKKYVEKSVSAVEAGEEPSQEILANLVKYYRTKPDNVDIEDPERPLAEMAAAERKAAHSARMKEKVNEANRLQSELAQTYRDQGGIINRTRAWLLDHMTVIPDSFDRLIQEYSDKIREVRENGN